MSTNAQPPQRTAHGELLDHLYAARQNPTEETRAELRDEVRIAAVILIAHELETIASTLASAIAGIESAIDTLSNTAP